MGAAWHSSVVGYLLIWGDATRVAAETSVRGRSGRSDDNTKSKTMTRTNNPPRAPAGGLAQRRALTGYVMDDDSIRTAVAAWFADQSAAEAGYGHISTWETSGVTDMAQLFADASSFNEDIGAWDISGVTSFRDMFKGALAFNQTLGWCLEDMEDADIDVNTFKDTPCESTNCGVAEQGAGCFLPTPRPTPAPPSAAPTAPTTAELVPVPTYSPAPSPVPGTPTQRPTPGPSPALTTAPTTPAPTPTQTAVQVTSSVTLEGIVATEFNSDEGLKAAFAQSVLDSAGGAFEEVIDIEAVGRRR